MRALARTTGLLATAAADGVEGQVCLEVFNRGCTIGREGLGAGRRLSSVRPHLFVMAFVLDGDGREVAREAPDRALLKVTRKLRDAEALVAHLYTRYLGDLSGGQILRRAVVRAYGLAGPGETTLDARAGVAFYDFPEIGAATALDIGASNWALTRLPVSFHTVLRSSIPGVVLCFAIALRLERPKPLALQQPREGYCMACKLEPATLAQHAGAVVARLADSEIIVR